MPFCPFCRTEYPARETRCPDCQVRLVDELPARPAYQPVEEVPAAQFPSQVEAEMWAEVLAEVGIPCVLVPLGPGAGGFGTSLWVPHELRVRADDLKRARDLLPSSP